MLNRQELTTTIKELKGRKVEAAQALHSVRTNAPVDVVLLLLKVKGGHWHRVFLDAGVLFWEETRSLDPTDTDVEPAGDRSFELRDLEPVVGQTLGVVTMAQADDGGVLTVPFVGGGSLVLACRDAGLDEEHTTLVVTLPPSPAE